MVQFKAKVLYEWNANDENEISLEEGETIEVLDHRDKDGWWVGRKEDGYVDGPSPPLSPPPPPPPPLLL